MTLGRYRNLIQELTTPRQPSEPTAIPSDPAPARQLETTRVEPSNHEKQPIDEPPSPPPGITNQVPLAVEVPPAEPPPLPRPKALVISDPERELLGEVGSIVPTPRAAKRLVNIYRMLRVSVQESELKAFLPTGENEYQAVVVLLGVLIGRPSRAHDVFEKLDTAADTDNVWEVLSQFQDVYEPLATIQDNITVTQAGPYRRWAPRVARFSFRLPEVFQMDEESAGTRPRSGSHDSRAATDLEGPG